MSAAFQLTIEGDEVPHTQVQARTPRAALTDAQIEIVQWLLQYGWISSKAAGHIVHMHSAKRAWPFNPERVRAHVELRAPYESSAGSRALKRLARRGIVTRVERGAWWLTEAT